MIASNISPAVPEAIESPAAVRMTTSTETFELLAVGPFGPGDVRVIDAPGWRMPSDAVGRAAIDREWRRQRRWALAKGTVLYSGRLFRLCAHRHNGRGCLRLTLGRTTYREYVGTRTTDFALARRRDALANPLAVSAAIGTGDGAIVLSRRWGVDLGDGRYDVIGGFLDPGRDADPFAGMAREIEEEIGLGRESVHLMALGLIYDRLHPHYDLCFAAQTDLSFPALARLQPGEPELRRLHHLDDSPESVAAFLAAQHGRMSATAEGCLTLYAQHRWGIPRETRGPARSKTGKV